MNDTGVLRQLAAGLDGLTETDAHDLLAAMLDGGLGELEQGAALALLELRGIVVPELVGFHVALAQRCFRLLAPAAAARPVVFSSHGGVRHQPNLLPLVALVLQRLGVPVLIHGALDGGGGVACVSILRELGVMPCASLGQAQEQLDRRQLAFVPTAVIAPGVAQLLALRGRLGFSHFAGLLARLLDPFEGERLLAVAAGSEADRVLLRGVLQDLPGSALLFDGTEGEAFADPLRRPALELIRGGESSELFAAEGGPVRLRAPMPESVDAITTARWIRQVVGGETPLPLPLVNQIACCLYGSGYTQDMNQAKAIVAVETGSLMAA